MNENEALAICFANLKGPRDKDLLGTAKALKFLKDLPQYRSNLALSRALGVSPEIVREFLGLLDLPTPVQNLLSKKRLSLEHGRRLRQLARHRPEVLTEVAEIVSGMTAMDARNFVEYVRLHPELTVKDAKKVFLSSKDRIVDEFHVVAVLSSADFSKLSDAAGKQRTNVNDLVTALVRSWLESHA